MGTKDQKRNRRHRLWILQGGKCCWCQRNMMHWNDLRSDPTKKETHGLKIGSDGVERWKRLPLTLATLEHLRDKYDPTRTINPVNKEPRWALACWECNNKRGAQRTKEQPIENLWKRSGKFPSKNLLNNPTSDDTSPP